MRATLSPVLTFAFCLFTFAFIVCGGFEVARTNATAERVCVASAGYKKTRKLNDARGECAGTDVATVGGRVSKRCCRARTLAVGEPYGSDTARLTNSFKGEPEKYEEACTRGRARPVCVRRERCLRAERQQHGTRRPLDGEASPPASPRTSSSSPRPQKGEGRQHEHVIPKRRRRATRARRADPSLKTRG